MDWLYYSLGIFALVLLSALFSGAETAMTAISDRVWQLARKGDWRARIVINLRENKERLLSAILIGNNIVNTLASSLATYFMVTNFGDVGVIYATVSMTLLLVIFAEVMPKTIAFHRPDGFAFTLAPLLRPIILLLMPLVIILQAVLKLLFLPFGVKIDYAPLVDAKKNRDILRGAIERHKMSEIIQEQKMMASILDLEKVEVGSIVTHRSNVAMIDKNMASDAVIKLILQSPYTRLPLYDKKPENIVGVLHSKDLFRAYSDKSRKQEKIDVTALATDPWFIPESTSLLDQLRAFQTRRGHFALVVDEYGTFMGIVTLEDIIEEIVGNIDDEHDVHVAGIRRDHDGSHIIRGEVTVRDLNRELEWELPEDKAATIAGLLMREAQILPEPGQIFDFYGFRFTVLRKAGNRISTLRIARLKPQQGLDPSL